MKEKSTLKFRAFIYSLDAFIAFLIIAFAISIISFFSSSFTFREPTIYQLKTLSLDIYRMYLYSKINNLPINCEQLGKIMNATVKYYFKIKCFEDGSEKEFFSERKSTIALVKDVYLVIYYKNGESENENREELTCKEKTSSDDLGTFIQEYLEIEIGI